MAAGKEKILYHSKPTIWYYLLAIFFPVMFFLIDDSKQLVFETWEKTAETYIINSLVLLMCFGTPVLMLFLRREITVYPDRVDISRPTANSSRTYYFADLVNWNITDIYIHKGGRQINLNLRFKDKKLAFNKIELSGFTTLQNILEANYHDRKSN